MSFVTIIDEIDHQIAKKDSPRGNMHYQRILLSLLIVTAHIPSPAHAASNNWNTISEYAQWAWGALPSRQKVVDTLNPANLTYEQKKLLLIGAAATGLLGAGAYYMFKSPSLSPQEQDIQQLIKLSQQNMDLFLESPDLNRINILKQIWENREQLLRLLTTRPTPMSESFENNHAWPTIQKINTFLLKQIPSLDIASENALATLEKLNPVDTNSINNNALKTSFTDIQQALDKKKSATKYYQIIKNHLLKKTAPFQQFLTNFPDRINDLFHEDKKILLAQFTALKSTIQFQQQSAPAAPTPEISASAQESSTCTQEKEKQSQQTEPAPAATTSPVGSAPSPQLDTPPQPPAASAKKDRPHTVSTSILFESTLPVDPITQIIKQIEAINIVANDAQEQIDALEQSVINKSMDMSQIQNIQNLVQKKRLAIELAAELKELRNNVTPEQLQNLVQKIDAYGKKEELLDADRDTLNNKIKELHKKIIAGTQNITYKRKRRDLSEALPPQQVQQLDAATKPSSLTSAQAPLSTPSNIPQETTAALDTKTEHPTQTQAPEQKQITEKPDTSSPIKISKLVDNNVERATKFIQKKLLDLMIIDVNKKDALDNITNLEQEYRNNLQSLTDIQRNSIKNLIHDFEQQLKNKKEAFFKIQQKANSAGEHAITPPALAQQPTTKPREKEAEKEPATSSPQTPQQENPYIAWHTLEQPFYQDPITNIIIINDTHEKIQLLGNYVSQEPGHDSKQTNVKQMLEQGGILELKNDVKSINMTYYNAEGSWYNSITHAITESNLAKEIQAISIYTDPSTNSYTYKIISIAASEINPILKNKSPQEIEYLVKNEPHTILGIRPEASYHEVETALQEQIKKKSNEQAQAYLNKAAYYMQAGSPEQRQQLIAHGKQINDVLRTQVGVVPDDQIDDPAIWNVPSLQSELVKVKHRFGPDDTFAKQYMAKALIIYYYAIAHTLGHIFDEGTIVIHDNPDDASKPNASTVLAFLANMPEVYKRNASHFNGLARLEPDKYPHLARSLSANTFYGLDLDLSKEKSSTENPKTTILFNKIASKQQTDFVLGNMWSDNIPTSLFIKPEKHGTQKGNLLAHAADLAVTQANKLLNDSDDQPRYSKERVPVYLQNEFKNLIATTVASIDAYATGEENDILFKNMAKVYLSKLDKNDLLQKLSNNTLSTREKLYIQQSLKETLPYDQTRQQALNLLKYNTVDGWGIQKYLQLTNTQNPPRTMDGQDLIVMFAPNAANAFRQMILDKAHATNPDGSPDQITRAKYTYLDHRFGHEVLLSNTEFDMPIKQDPMFLGSIAD